MYAYIQGQLVYKSPTLVIIETGGIGYEINVSLTTYDQIANLEACKLYTHLTIREDAHLLYGFYDPEEKRLFQQLLGVSGVGPNLGRMVLSSLAPNELKKAIIEGDHALITSIKGIGSKSGQKIIIELQETLKKETSEEVFSGRDETNAGQGKEEALQGLVMLGFKKNEAEKALSKVLKEQGNQTGSDELIKLALKKL